MTALVERFTVEVLDSSGNVTGAGPLYNVLAVSITEELDKIGTIALAVPATDDHVIQLVSAEKQVRVRTADGIIAHGFIHNIGLVIAPDGRHVRQVSGPDLLGELAYLSTGYDRVYDDLDVKTVIVGATGTATSLLGGTGWTQGTVEDYGNSTITYNTESRFLALTMLARQLGRHVRAASTTGRTLDFGLFGADSGYWLTNVHHFLRDQEAPLVVIGSINVGTISADVENRMLPLGKSKFDMRDARDYQIDTSSPATGTITNATNASPIVITSATHGLATNDFVRAADVGGNTAANGDWQIIVVNANTFSLNGSTGNGAYTSGGRWDELEAAAILVRTSVGPTGLATTLNGAVSAGDGTITLTSVTNVAEDDELWIGDETDWTQTHEIVVAKSIAGNIVTIHDELANAYGDGTTVIRRPQFYVEDAASQATYGVRENCPQFGWIAPVDLSADLSMQQKAADTLYAAANARLTRYKDEYKSYVLSDVLNLPHDLRVGQKVRVVYTGVVGVFGGTVFESIDDDFYVIKITRTWMANGTERAALEVANVSRPTPSNIALVVFNLTTNQWVGL